MADSPTAILLHHGLGEHAGRYDRFAEALGNVTVVAHDVRGHGGSDGRRGDALGIEQLADDWVGLFPRLAELSGAKRFVLFGHSMGSLVLLEVLERGRMPDGTVGAIVSAPPVAVERTHAVRAKVAFGRVVKFVAPGLRLANEVSLEGISSDEGEVARYQSDPLVHDRLSIRLGLSILEWGPRVIDGASRISTPGLIVAGSDDPIAPVAGARALAANWPGVRLDVIEGNRHEGHHERSEGRERWFASVRGFLEGIGA